MRRLLAMLLAITMIIGIMPAMSAQAATKTVTVEAFLKQVVNAMKLKVDQEEKSPYLSAAIKEGVVKEGEFSNKEILTRQVAAVIANRADEILDGPEYDKKLYERVVNGKRISDLSKVDKDKKDSVIKVYMKGIMEGNSNGMYNQSRKFNPAIQVTSDEANTIVSRITSVSKRRIMSPYGDLTRTTNLPKNYKKYPYILECLPNAFYEMHFYYQDATYSYQPVNLKDYASPKDMKRVEYNTGYEVLKFTDMYEKYGEEWLEKIRTNLECRLNFDYRTVDNKWISKLRNTYYFYGDATADKKTTDKIKAYVKTAKKNKVIVKADKIVIEPSTIHKDSGFYVRCYVKFKVSANTVYNAASGKQHELIFSWWNNTYLTKLKKSQWYEGYYDIKISGIAFGDDGEDFSVTWDILADKN